MISPKNPIHITKEFHLQHLLHMLPVLTLIFGMQCLTMPVFFSGMDLGNLYLILASGLVLGILALYFYDTKVVQFIDNGNLYLQISSLKFIQSYPLVQLKNIDVMDSDPYFSNLKLTFHSGKILNLYFVDHPQKMVQIILKEKEKEIQKQLDQKKSNNEKLDVAA